MFQHYRYSLTMIAAVALLVATGCGGRPTAQVSGTVKYKDGSPIVAPAKVVRFVPAPDTTAEIRKAASGYIQDDGTFEMYTQKPGDGVIKGQYVVVFSVLENPMGGESLLKEEYGDPDLSPYTIDVDSDQNDLVYEVEKK